MKYHYSEGENVYRTMDYLYVEYWNEKARSWRESTLRWRTPPIVERVWTDSIEELLEHHSEDPDATKCILRLV